MSGKMKKMKLGAKLNISFALLFVPLIIAMVFSIVYYSHKITDEAINTISSDLKIADIIYQNALLEIKNLANAYAQKKTITVLLGLNMGEKLGDDLAKTTQTDNLDMVTVVDTEFQVVVRSHAPAKLNDKIILNKKIIADYAFYGKTISSTEVLSRQEVEQEGLEYYWGSNNSNVLVIVGIGPVYDRQRTHIVGAIIVRRILNHKTKLVEKITDLLNVHTAIFEHANLVATCAPNGLSNKFVKPETNILKQVMQTNASLYQANISEGGAISKYMPITNYDHDPVGILMVQSGVQTYIHTRNIAVITLLMIFLTAFILSFTIKTIIERSIVKPVRILKKGTELIGEGNYQYKLEVFSGDEIGELTVAFNKMIHDLNQYDQQLKNYNQQLETKVTERTSELQIANKQLISSNTALEDTLETLNPGVSRLIGSNQQQLGLVYATELVVDICNYTKLNMILGETIMGEFMKKFFRESHKLLAAFRGMFDKTVGDQIVAIFGISKDQIPAAPAHAFDAIECARKIVAAAADINTLLQVAIQDNYTAIMERHNSLSKEDRKNILIQDLRFQCRIGINTSNPTSDREIDRMRMVMMGAETCVDYTAQGGSVIYAFRLESSGIPGQIHVGENTKRLVEQVHCLEELPSIALKGLGIQPGYRVSGKVSIFDNIFPQTLFYKQYYNNIPELLLELIQTIKVGRVQIREVRKINQYLDVDLHYLEHLAGFYNLTLARALFSYAVANAMGADQESLDAMLFASLWYNGLLLRNASNNYIESFEVITIEKQIPDGINKELSIQITEDIRTLGSNLQEARIIALCNQFDHMVFDRTYLKERTQEIISSKEVLSLMRIEDKFDSGLLSTLHDLMIALNTEEKPKQSCKILNMPKNAEEFAGVIKDRLSSEEYQRLRSIL